MKRRDFLKLPALAALPVLPALPAIAAPIAAATEAARPWPQSTVIHISGERFSSEDIRRLIATINDAEKVVLT